MQKIQPLSASSDPFVIVGYGECTIRCMTHRRPDGLFQSYLRVKDEASKQGEVLFDDTFEVPFANADAALNWAMLRGQQIVGRHHEGRERKPRRRRA